MDIGRIKRTRKTEDDKNAMEEQNIYEDFEKKIIKPQVNNEKDSNDKEEIKEDIRPYYQEKEYKTNTLEENTVVTNASKISRFLLFGFYSLFIIIGVVVFFMLRADKYEFYLKKDEVSIFTGSTYQVELTPKNIRYFDYLNYNYSVSDPSVATVDEFGTVTAVGEGTTTLKISLSPGFTSKTMKIHSERISIDTLSLMIFKDDKYQMGDSITLSLDQSISLKAIANGREDLNTTVTYSSSNSSVAIVDEFGNVTAKKEGNAIITATKDGVEGKLNVTVKKGSSSSSSSKTIQNISFSPDALTVKKGSSVRLVVNVTPKELSSSSFVWTSSNNNIATVDGSGLVKAISNGKTVITAKSSNGLITNCSITVTDEEVKISKITLNSSKETIYVGGSYQLKATISPQTATLRNITWESSNPSVAKVENGNVVAVSAGTATITASNDDGSVKATSVITVKKSTPTPTPSSSGKVTKVTLSAGQTTKYVGETLQLSTTVTPSSVTNYTATWSSSNSNVATVSNTGLVSTKKAGTVVITVEVEGTKASCTIIVKNKQSSNPTPTGTPTQTPTQTPQVPASTFNKSYVNISTQTLTVNKGATAKFKVKLYNAVGLFAIKTSNGGATVDKSTLWLDGLTEDTGEPYWAEKEVTVTGVTPGTTQIVITPDTAGIATYDTEKELSGSHTIVVTVK